MRILGVDTGIERTGWAVLEVFNLGNSKKIKATDYGCIKTSSKKQFHERFVEIGNALEEIIKKFHPCVMAVEELFFLKKAKTLLAIAQARGIVVYVAAKNGMKIFQYNPKTVKIALTGYGASDKNQMQIMVKNVLSLKEVPTSDDTADAIAVALCHYFNHERFG